MVKKVKVFCNMDQMAESTVKIEGLLGMLMVKPQDDNFVKWSFQFQSILRGYDLFYHFTETRVTKEVTVAYKDWVKKDLALLSLLIATLSDDIMDHILGGESIDRFLLRVKAIRDQLVSAGERITYNDFLIAVLFGLPPEFEMIKTVILARDSHISYKDLSAQLLGAEASIESKVKSLTASMATISNSQRYQGGYEGEQSTDAQFGFHGGSRSIGNGSKFVQKNSFSRGNRKYNGNSRNYSGNGNQFGNKSGNESSNGNPPPSSSTAMTAQANIVQNAS
ncbi:unnamed protein product [Malus baccata var. baccata]